MTGRRLRTLVAVALSLVIGGAAGVAAGYALPHADPHANASEPMDVSTLPDGSELRTYVHVDPDTGSQLYVTVGGGGVGVWPRLTVVGPGAGRDTIVYDRTEAQDG